MLKLFADVKLVKGYTRSMLQDFTRGKYYLIPNLLARFIEKYDAKKELSDIKQSYGNREPELFQDYYKLLTDNELIFDIPRSHLALFEEINDEYASPFIVDCVTFVLSTQNYERIKYAIDNCFFENVTNYRIIVLPNVPSCDFFALMHALEQYLPASCFISMPKNYTNQPELDNLSTVYPEILKYEFIEDNIDTYFNNDHYVKQFPLIMNSIFVYLEARHRNIYFNKRLFIDADGYIKNSPNCDMIFGNIIDFDNKDKFLKLINQDSFQKYWHIKKDTIEICKDCELRYMCVDNRCPINIDNNYWKRAEECSYNPYICKWKHEAGYISTEACGGYQKIGFVPDPDKIKALNAQIWGEDDE